MTNIDGETCTVLSKKRGPEKSARRKAADAAGLSRAQMWRAMQVAAIPESEFDNIVESDNPPTVSELVKIGTGNKPKANAIKNCPHCGGELP